MVSSRSSTSCGGSASTSAMASRQRPDSPISHHRFDDIDLLPVGEDGTEAFYRIIDAAYERRSIAVTSNIHPSGFDTIMPKTLAGASTDRLMHHAHLVTTSGDSHRLAEALSGKEVVPLACPLPTQEHRWPQAWISDGHQPGHPTAAHLGISMAVDRWRHPSGPGPASTSSVPGLGQGITVVKVLLTRRSPDRHRFDLFEYMIGRTAPRSDPDTTYQACGHCGRPRPVPCPRSRERAGRWRQGGDGRRRSGPRGYGKPRRAAGVDDRGDPPGDGARRVRQGRLRDDDGLRPEGRASRDLRRVGRP
ncbi:ATP-binding protein [Kitasatospora sp. NPDC003701]